MCRCVCAHMCVCEIYILVTTFFYCFRLYRVLAFKTNSLWTWLSSSFFFKNKCLNFILIAKDQQKNTKSLKKGPNH